MTVEPMVSVWNRLAQERPGQPALTVGDKPSVVWAELHGRSNQLARLYAAKGVGQGDFVTIALPTCVEGVEALLATLKLGAIPNPISSRLPWIERRQLIDLANPKLCVLDTDEALTDRTTVTGRPDLSGIDPSDLPVIISPSLKAPTSGGSSGRPKIILSAAPAMIDDGADTLVRKLGMPSDGCCLFAGPLYHNTAVSGCLLGLSLRNHIVLEERFDPELTLRLIERHRVEFTIMVPTMMNRIWRLPEEVRDAYDLSSLKIVQHNAAACPPDLKRAWLDWIGPERLYESYAATEQTAIVIASGHDWLRRPGTVGKVIYGELQVRNDDGDACPPDVVGTIWMRRPEGAPRSFLYMGQETPDPVDRWETVGDLGYLDEEGYLFLADRRSDLVISGGSNIYPAEVEAALDAHPDVVETVVVGLPDDDMGELVHAVVSYSGDALTAEMLDSFVRERIARYKCPRSYELTREPLRDDAGKVRRSNYRERAIEAAPSVRPSDRTTIGGA